MVRLALQSLKMQPHKNWEMAFVDDGSDIPGKPIAEEILGEEANKVLFFNTNSTREQKQERGGSKFGKCWNLAMYNSKADIAIMLCDDALYIDYLGNLSKFYTANPHVVYSYGHVSVFNPVLFNDITDVPTELDTSYAEFEKNTGRAHLNKFTTTIVPFDHVDSTQVSWKIAPIVDKKIGFPFPKNADLDSVFYQQLYKHFGDCAYNGLITQYKGVHEDQLGVRARTPMGDWYKIKDN